jgi:3-methylcrotonyl-CoA carboxylase beta subunit
MLEKNAMLERITDDIMDVGDKYRALSISRDKLLPRERINALIDKGSPFLELSQLAGYKEKFDGDSIPSANLLSGIGVVNGRQVMIVANYHAFTAGVYYPCTVKKHIRA